MDEDEATQPTQDPRRLGRNNSGLNDADIADVVCILHPCSPAAFKVVACTAEVSPQNVLQKQDYDDYGDGVSQAVVEEQETFILGSGSSGLQPMDLALRFSTNVIRPHIGFVFGRNATRCDVVLGTYTGRRVSNMHFRIFMNSAGVLMLADMSTNGTVVDEVVLRGKSSPDTATRMLQPGSIIQVLSPNPDEVIKFIVRVPSREGHLSEYSSNFNKWMQRATLAAIDAERENKQTDKRPAFPNTNQRTQSGLVNAPMMSMQQFGMHWGGGEKYNVVGQIGKGAFATVYQLATKIDGQLYAAKELEKRKFMKNGVLDRKVDNELQIMKAVNHPNIVNFVDYYDVANHLYIIMEFVPCGDLQQYMTLLNPQPLTESLTKQMAAQVFDALEYLHTKKITHRDIKPDNILISDLQADHFVVKLSDFGLSKVVKDNETFLKTFCGTLLYCAPEVFPHYDAHVAGKGKKRPRKSGSEHVFHSYSQSVDIWSFGAVLWYALCLKPPFEGVTGGVNGKGMFDKIMMTPLDPGDLMKQGISKHAVALLIEMLNTDPAARPSPAYCSKHPWFGYEQAATVGAADVGLEVIAEEHEAEEPDVSGLSLQEQDSAPDSQDSEEPGLTSSDIRYYADMRQSKRFKSDPFMYRDQSYGGDSSAEAMFDNIPIVNQAQVSVIGPSQPLQRKLFGEISHRALQSSGALGNNAATTRVSSNAGSGSSLQNSTSWDGVLNGQDPSAEGALASPSLLGAESLVRDLNMDSPNHSGSSPGLEPNEPTTPNTPDSRKPAAASSHANDTTPRPIQPSTFNRQIHLEKTPSFYYDPHDPSTHSLEYASKVSGYDFVKNLSYKKDAQTTSRSTTDADQPVVHEEPQAPTPGFVKPPPRLGRLVSTAESFASVTINLTNRDTQWGRAPNNTNIYPNAKETRVAKRALSLWFHANNIDDIPESDDSWTKLPDLHCLITTEASMGIYVNDVLLQKGDKDVKPFGRLYTGDVITVWRGNGKPDLTFVCEFSHGEGKDKRPDGAPAFKIETTRGSAGSSKGQANGKERGWSSVD